MTTARLYPALTQEQKDQVLDLYSRGFGAATLTRMVGLPSTTQVERYLRQEGRLRSIEAARPLTHERQVGLPRGES